MINELINAKIVSLMRPDHKIRFVRKILINLKIEFVLFLFFIFLTDK